jgi:ABC-2 type transport system permease protein
MEERSNGLQNILAIIERETKAYFFSPMAYVLILFFIFISGMAYVFYVFQSHQAELSGIVGFMSTLILFLSPLITMRLFAEERRTGTLEVLLTCPVTETEVVVGKFGSAVLTLLIMLALTAHYPLFLILFGTPDKGPLWSSYLGLVLLGSCYLSIGLLASSLAKNQIVAAVLAFGVCLMLLILSAFSNFVTGNIGETFKYLSFYDHFEDFMRGVIDTKHLIFYFSFIGFMLFLTVLNIRNKKWR